VEEGNTMGYAKHSCLTTPQSLICKKKIFLDKKTLEGYIIDFTTELNQSYSQQRIDYEGKLRE
jgi:hypothetical protein